MSQLSRFAFRSSGRELCGSTGRTWLLLGACVVIALSILIYWPGLSGPLVLDDYPQLLPIMEDRQLASGWTAHVLSGHGPLGRPVAMLSFVANQLWGGTDPFDWKLVNLVLHLSCGLLLWLLVAHLLSGEKLRPASSDWMAGGLVAAIWTVHPLHVSTVLYTVQRMTLLASLFTVLALLAYLIARKHQQKGLPWKAWMALSLLVAFPLACLSKETGVMVPALALLIEATILRWSDRSRFAGALAAATVAAGVFVALYYVVNYERLIAIPYSGREFTLWERLMTFPRALAWYADAFLLPTQAKLSFLHDDFAPTRSLLDVSTLACLAMLGAAVIAGWLLRKRSPLVLFGVMFFLVGHALEGTVLPLELLFEHRNYLPSAGLLLALAGVIAAVTPNLRLVSAVSAALFLVLGLLTASRAHVWTHAETLYAHATSARPGSDRAAAMYAEVLTAHGKLDEALAHIAPRPGAGPAVHALYLRCRSGESVSPSDLKAVAQKLSRAVDSYLATGLMELAGLGLDGLCGMDFMSFIGLLDETLARNFSDPVNRAKLLIYKAHLLWASGKADQAIATLDETAAEVGSDPVPLLLAAEWLVEMGDLGAAREYLERAEARSSSGRRDYKGMLADVRDRIDGAPRQTPPVAGTPRS